MKPYLIYICHGLNLCFSVRVFWLFKERGMGVNFLLDPIFSTSLCAAMIANLIRWHFELGQSKYSNIQSFTRKDFEKKLREVYSIMYGAFPYFLKFFPSSKKFNIHLTESLEITKSSDHQESIVETALKIKDLFFICFIFVLISVGSLYVGGGVSYLIVLQLHWVFMGIFFMQIAGFALNSLTTCFYVIFKSISMEKK